MDVAEMTHLTRSEKLILQFVCSRIAEGNHVPTNRELAAATGVTTRTVSRAIRRLAAIDALKVTVTGWGVRVIQGPDLPNVYPLDISCLPPRHLDEKCLPPPENLSIDKNILIGDGAPISTRDNLPDQQAESKLSHLVPTPAHDPELTTGPTVGISGQRVHHLPKAPEPVVVHIDPEPAIVTDPSAIPTDEQITAHCQSLRVNIPPRYGIMIVDQAASRGWVHANNEPITNWMAYLRGAWVRKPDDWSAEVKRYFAAKERDATKIAQIDTDTPTACPEPILSELSTARLHDRAAAAAARRSTYGAFAADTVVVQAERSITITQPSDRDMLYPPTAGVPS